MKKLYIQSLIFLCIAKIRHTESTVDKDAFKSTAQLIASQGYPVEEYDIMTEDWYIITVQRIPAGRGATAGGIRKRKPVVFLMSGLEGCSADYVVNLPHQSLGFILADNSFDVWIGNVRGTKYSRHLFLERKQRKFWNFCLDEMIRYDLPAQIDSILYHTGEAALQFVGWSQGGGIMFGFLADRPEYNKKKIVDLLFGGTLTGRNEQLLNKVKLLSCRSVRPRGLCNASFILMNGGYPIDMNTTRLPVYLANDPAGTSVRNVLHLAQVTADEKWSLE
nr:lipase member K-like [Rhipicephalus microplus]